MITSRIGSVVWFRPSTSPELVARTGRDATAIACYLPDTVVDDFPFEASTTPLRFDATDDCVSRKPIPEGSILEGYEHLGAFNGERRWRSKDGTRLFTWDALHGEVEVYNARGFHLGALDPITGVLVKPAVRGRRIDV